MFQLNAYSQVVNNPTIATIAEQAVIKYAKYGFPALSMNNKQKPNSSKQTAVLNFMELRPGKTDFSTPISSNQPINARLLRRMVKTPITTVTCILRLRIINKSEL